MGTETETLIAAAQTKVTTASDLVTKMAPPFSKLKLALKKLEGTEAVQAKFDYKAAYINAPIPEMTVAKKAISDLKKKIKSKEWWNVLKKQKSLDAAQIAYNKAVGDYNAMVKSYNEISTFTGHDHQQPAI
jgi:hypothetical protein